MKKRLRKNHQAKDHHSRSGARPTRARSNAKRVAPTADPAPRPAQQDRGQRRIDSILDAAEEVIAEVGYEAATTDAIAKRAGASMGSFYHFFPNKEAVLAALGQRFAERMSAINALAMPVEVVWLPLDVLFDRIVDGQMQFCTTTRAFRPVTEALERHLGASEPNELLHEALMSQVRSFLAARCPRMPARDRELAARIAITSVHAVIDESMRPRVPPDQRDGLVRELKRLMVRYFAPLDEQYGVKRG